MRSRNTLAALLLCGHVAFAQLSTSGNAPVATPDTAPVSQSITALNGAAQISLGGQASVSVTLTGTWVAVITPELSFDGGATWIATYFRLPAIGQIQNTVSAIGSYAIVTVGGASHARVRASAFTSGTITAALRASQASDVTQVIGSTGANITAAATTAVKATSGILRRVIVGTGVASATIKLFNVAGASCTGTPGSGASGIVSLPATLGNPFTLEFNQIFNAGICVVTSGATNITIVFD